MGRSLDQRRESQRKYLKSRKMVSFVLDKVADKEIIDWLERQKNQSEAIREALREVRI